MVYGQLLRVDVPRPSLHVGPVTLANDDDRIDESEVGLGFHLGLGKEWWASSDWGLGVAAELGDGAHPQRRVQLGAREGEVVRVSEVDRGRLGHRLTVGDGLYVGDAQLDAVGVTFSARRVTLDAIGRRRIELAHRQGKIVRVSFVTARGEYQVPGIVRGGRATRIVPTLVPAGAQRHRHGHHHHQRSA
jgi:hypothetical protein